MRCRNEREGNGRGTGVRLTGSTQVEEYLLFPAGRLLEPGAAQESAATTGASVLGVVALGAALIGAGVYLVRRNRRWA